MKAIIFAATVLASGAAYASSFVGNGGSPGDVELAVARQQIQGTLQDFTTWEADENPCVCGPNMERSSMCAYLKDLTAAQIRTCSAFIHEKGPELKALFQHGEIQIEWTHEKITVMENGRRRAVDAVANAKTGRLTLDKNRFVEMGAADRIFLLTHEGLHFMKWKGKELVDEGSFDSFSGPEGGRHFINSVAAAVAVGAYESNQISGYQAALNRSKSYKKYWIDASITGMNAGDSTSNFAVKNLSGTALAFRYSFGDFGVGVEYTSRTGDKSHLNTIKGDERRVTTAIGAHYRFFPSKDPLSYWGPSHLLLGVKYAQLSGTYKLKDDFISLDDSASVTGLGIDCHYYFPFRSGLWGFVSLSYLQAGVEYSKVNLRYEGNPTTIGYGVSYGF